MGAAAAGCSSPEAPSRGRPEEGDATPPWGNPEADQGMTTTLRGPVGAEKEEQKP